MDDVIITIPIYHIDFSPTELISWQQLHKILGKYPICLVMPNSLRTRYTNSECHRIETFPDKYFQSPQTYSQLLMSPSFYERFTDYEYMLIYQLDAFVFSDKLAYFCSLGYDYIGAPWLRWTNYWHSMRTRPSFPYIPFRPRVGNGGFSLRRISVMLRVLQRKDEILQTHPLSKLFQEQEDMFFAYCGTIPNGLKIPDVYIAKRFSIEADVGHCYRKILNCLPFGSHAWTKINLSMWKSIVEPQYYGGNITFVDSNIDDDRQIVLYFYLIERMSRQSNLHIAKKAIDRIFYKREYAVWGLGNYGKILVSKLKAMKVNLTCLIDNNPKVCSSYEGISVITPNEHTLKRYKGSLIIGTVDSKKKIANDLVCRYKFNDNDYMDFTNIFEKLFSEYYLSLRRVKHEQ